MKSKAPLVMMEQMVMILVFALAAALCLQAFVLSDNMSAEGRDRDRAVLLCQNTAEQWKAVSRLGGEADMPEDKVQVFYNEALEPTEGPSAYRVETEPLEESRENLQKFSIRAFKEESGQELFSIELGLQREMGKGAGGNG